VSHFKAISDFRKARLSAVSDLRGLPPIEVYQIGDVYFVRDGNHRVSVARQLEAPTIQAYVTEIRARVPLSPDVQPDELILKTEYAEFLECTRLDEHRQQADLTVTTPGRYPKIEEHIEVHRYYMGLDQGREISFQEAAVHWYDEVYVPVVAAIRTRGILRDFPERTETDLYLWVSEHRAALEEALGWEVETGSAAADLADRHSTRPRRVAARVGERLLDAVTPDGLESGPSPGQWRSERLASRRAERLFIDILVPVSGQEIGWRALNQALEVARREDGRLRGLYVVPSADHLESKAARSVKSAFEGICQDAGVTGTLIIEVGKVARKIAALARWTDLVVVNLAHPPGEQPVARLGSGFRSLLLRSSRPVLAVPSVRSPLQRGLLAYDGSPKADEALYIAAYLAGRWQIHLAVITVLEDKRITPDVAYKARAYLEAQGVQATYVEQSGPVAEAILGG
jgi:nucleotide-binding universal stress UspA family protein